MDFVSNKNLYEFLEREKLSFGNFSFSIMGETVGRAMHDRNIVLSEALARKLFGLLDKNLSSFEYDDSRLAELADIANNIGDSIVSLRRHVPTKIYEQPRLISKPDENVSYANSGDLRTVTYSMNCPKPWSC